ncbi:MAG TPA: chloride channel protein [Candidatus Polarisedimenticolia bacterium]|jgi:CIC family chloride channel protein|nr:chloride channel protein [Candidatus Polarisedimenticolia bacterium]
MTWRDVRLPAFFRTRPGDRRFIFLVPLTGLLTGIASTALIRLLGQVQKGFWGDGRHLLAAALELPWWQRLAAPMIGGVLVGLVMLAVKRPLVTTGTTGLIEAVAKKSGILTAGETVLGALATLLTVGSGGSLGREAPLVHSGATIGSILGRRMGLSAQRIKILLACGAASGIAAAYNAPIGGALFGLEVILGNFALEAFGPVVVSTAIATVVSRRLSGAYLAYQPPMLPSLVSTWELGYYLLMGLGFGIAGVLFLWGVRGGGRLFERLPIPPPLKPMVGLGLVGLIGLEFPHVFGNGYDTVDLVLHGSLPLLFVLILPVLKTAATAATAGSGGAGGMFTPTLFVGSMLGSAYGTWAHALSPLTTASPIVYALVGMGAMLAATTQAPLTAILMIFELTGDYQILLPLMFACGLSIVMARLVGGRSQYTAALEERGVRLGGRLEELVMDTIHVREVMRHGVSGVPENEPLDAVVRRMMDEGRKELYVVGEDGTFKGAITLAEMSEPLSHPESLKILKAGMVAGTDVPTLRPEDRLSEAIGRWSHLSLDRLPVVDKGMYLGELAAGDILFLYSQEVLRKEARLARFDRSGGSKAGTTYVELPSEYVVAEVTLPHAFRGMTLRQLDARRRFGLNILELKRRGARPSLEQRMMADPDMVLETGDTLIVVGRPSEIAVFRDGSQERSAVPAG